MINEDTHCSEADERHEADKVHIKNEEKRISEDDDLSIKEQIILLITALKVSLLQELGYLKARTVYSIKMVVKASIFFFIAFIFVLVAFILLGIGMLLALKSIMGVFGATILSVVIFLSLAVIMVWAGKIYINKLSFPELNDAELKTNDNDE